MSLPTTMYHVIVCCKRPISLQSWPNMYFSDNFISICSLKVYTIVLFGMINTVLDLTKMDKW